MLKVSDFDHIPVLLYQTVELTLLTSDLVVSMSTVQQAADHTALRSREE